MIAVRTDCHAEQRVAEDQTTVASLRVELLNLRAQLKRKDQQLAVLEHSAFPRSSPESSTLDRCRFPVPDPQITLLDLSVPCLAHAARRLARYSPETRRASVLDETLDLGEARFDSIALSGVLPCLPATMKQKTAALSRLRPYLADDEILFGSTILGRGVRHNGLARRVIATYNRKRIFTNLADDLQGLEQGLAAGFADVDVQTEGSTTMFTARP